MAIRRPIVRMTLFVVIPRPIVRTMLILVSVRVLVRVLAVRVTLPIVAVSETVTRHFTVRSTDLAPATQIEIPFLLQPLWAARMHVGQEGFPFEVVQDTAATNATVQWRPRHCWSNDQQRGEFTKITEGSTVTALKCAVRLLCTIWVHGIIATYLYV